MYALPGPVFFRLAWRISSYQGVMRDYAQLEAMRQQQSPEPGPAAMPAGGVTQVGGTRQELAHDPLMSQVISFG